MADDKEILELLRDIAFKLSTVATKDDLRALAVHVDEIDHNTDVFINGNGKEGAKVRLDRLERDLRSVQEEVRCIVDNVSNKITMRLIKTFGIPLGIALILWVAQVIYNASIQSPVP